MIQKKTWHEFRMVGLLWFINRTLHLFGWAICIDYEDVKKGTIKDVYPARCKFRGFHQKTEAEGFIRLTKHVKRNIKRLEKEVLS